MGQDEKVVCMQVQYCVAMRHTDFDDGQTLYAVTRFCKLCKTVTRQSGMWGPHGWGGWRAQKPWRNVYTNEFFKSQILSKMFAADNKNEPAPPAAPTLNNNNSNCVRFSWGSKLLDVWRKPRLREVHPTLVRILADWSASTFYLVIHMSKILAE